MADSEFWTDCVDSMRELTFVCGRSAVAAGANKVAEAGLDCETVAAEAKDMFKLVVDVIIDSLSECCRC